jgi:glycosyltransferase involved in cell wall biosynthesis
MAFSPPEPEPYPVHWVSRRLPVGARHAAAATLVARLARKAHVVYTTGMMTRSSLGAALGRAPAVIKLTSDPAFERALRLRLWEADQATFQQAHGVRIDALRRARDLALRRARTVIAPCEALRRVALGWGVSAQKLELLPNSVSPPPDLPTRDELRRRHGFEGPTLVFAGRLVPQKSIHITLEAIRRVPDVSLRLAGEGPFADGLQQLSRDFGLDGRVQFLGPQPRETVCELLRAADAMVLSSSWESFSYSILESLAVGTPVVATATGGSAEIVRDGWNGLLVRPGSSAELAAAITRFFDDRDLQRRLRAEARRSVARFAPEVINARLEKLLADAAQT